MARASADSVEMHEDALTAGEKVLIIDDLIATGGTALAAVKLIEGLGAKVVGASFVIDLPELGGMRKLHELGLRAEALCARVVPLLERVPQSAAAHAVACHFPGPLLTTRRMAEPA